MFSVPGAQIPAKDSSVSSPSGRGAIMRSRLDDDEEEVFESVTAEGVRRESETTVHGIT